MAKCIVSRELRFSAGLSSGGRIGTGQKGICSASAQDWNDGLNWRLADAADGITGVQADPSCRPVLTERVIPRPFVTAASFPSSMRD